MYIFIAVLAFGVIIAVHELGHFFVAKSMNVKVIEFSIGMGPKIISKQGKETLYSLRLIPFGGYCNMEGEYGEKLEEDSKHTKNKTRFGRDSDIAHTDFVLVEGAFPEVNESKREEDDGKWYKQGRENNPDEEDAQPDPRSFIAQKTWKRFLILVSGSIANIVAAFIILFIISLSAEGYISSVIATVTDGLPQEGQSEIMAGDRIVEINGERVFYYDDYGMFMGLYAGEPITLTLSRGGELIEYNRRSYMIDGEQVYRYRLTFAVIEPTILETLKYSAYQTFNFIRMIRVSIAMMANGSAGIADISGPVGIVNVMSTVAQESPSTGIAIANIIYLTAFIGVNVGVINLLPIPAMDGGRILFLYITWGYEKITRRQLNPKYENYINTGAFILLIGLMVLIMFNDIVKIVG